MLRIGITGIEGFIGWHLHAFLHGQPDVFINKANRATFASKDELLNFVSSSDVVVHLAGMNRGDEKEIEANNIGLVDALIDSCERANCRPHIIFSSSTHIYRGTAYGNTKMKCAERFKKWSEKSGAPFTNLILPNVFGEGGKPFYNSVVSTFCYQLANGLMPEIINDVRLEQIHAQKVALEIWNIFRTLRTGDVLLAGKPIKVSELLLKLKNFADIYQQQIIPEFDTEFDLDLFNTYRSYLFPGKYPVSTVLHEDDRGTLFEAVKSLNGGQTFISSTRPGITRGNHYHRTKLERFIVLSGQADICIRKLFSDKVETFHVDGRKPQYIDIPTLHTHNITNNGNKDLITLFWSHEIFDPAYPDTFAENV